MKKWLIVVLFLPFESMAASGNELYSLLTSPDVSEKMQAARYVQAVVGAEQYFLEFEKYKAASEQREANLSGLVCAPTNGYQLRQAVDIVERYLVAKPEVRHFSAFQQAHYALLAVWPCVFR
jgi:hypothetical protein